MISAFKTTFTVIIQGISNGQAQVGRPAFTRVKALTVYHDGAVSSHVTLTQD